MVLRSLSLSNPVPYPVSVPYLYFQNSISLWKKQIIKITKKKKKRKEKRQREEKKSRKEKKK